MTALPKLFSLPSRRRHEIVLEHAAGAASAFSAIADAPIDVVLGALRHARERDAPEVVAVVVAGVRVPRSEAWDDLVDDVSACRSAGRT
jgi:hypothetical protein